MDVLRGSNNQRIREYGHDKLAVYGIGKDKSREHWVSVLRQLIHLGLITQNIANYSALQLTESARPVLRGEVPLQLAVPRIQNIKPRQTARSYGGNYDKNCSRNCASCANPLRMRKISRRLWCLTMPHSLKWRNNARQGK